MRPGYVFIGLWFLIVFAVAYQLFSTAPAAAPSIPPERMASSTITHSNATNTTTMTMTLTSSAFADGAAIPAEYTCDGPNTPPPLAVAGVPEGAKTLVLIVDDPDIPQEVKDSMHIQKFDHWALYNIPATTTTITADSGTAALNGMGEAGYTGPCPPPQYQPTTHRYIFRLYALPNELNFAKVPTLDEVETAAKVESLATATLVGIYDKTVKQ